MGEIAPRSLFWAHRTLMDCLEAQPEARPRRKLNPALVPGSEPDQEMMIELLGTDYFRLLEPGSGEDPQVPPRIYPPQSSTQRAIDEALLLQDQGVIEVVEAWRCQV
ncbi:MAG: hypothetical protein AAGC79_18650 [Pseudomonadota bacterium]